MKSIPDKVLDVLEDSQVRETFEENLDGAFWFNPNPDGGRVPDGMSEVEYLYQNRRERIRGQFRAEFWPRSARYISALIVCGVALSIILLLAVGSVEAQILGLFVTIFGSIILGISLLRGPQKVLMATSTKAPTLDGSNIDAETKEYVHTTIDGINGIFYIVTGFTVQILGII